MAPAAGFAHLGAVGCDSLLMVMWPEYEIVSGDGQRHPFRIAPTGLAVKEDCYWNEQMRTGSAQAC